MNLTGVVIYYIMYFLLVITLYFPNRFHSASCYYDANAPTELPICPAFQLLKPRLFLFLKRHGYWKYSTVTIQSCSSASVANSCIRSLWAP